MQLKYIVLHLIIATGVISNLMADVNVCTEDLQLNHMKRDSVNVTHEDLRKYLNTLSNDSYKTKLTRKTVDPGVFSELLGEWQIAFKILDVFSYPIFIKEIAYLNDTIGYVASGYIQYTPQSVQIPMLCYHSSGIYFPRNEFTCYGYDGTYHIWYYLNQLNKSTLAGEYDITTSTEDAQTHYNAQQTFPLVGLKKLIKTVIVPF